MRLSDRTSLAVLTAFTVTVGLLFLSSWACIKILSGIRAYVGGEGLYSKAQKDAVFSLALYVRTGNEAWYSSFENSLQVPEGDRDARIELEKPHPDWPIVWRGFITGGNSPEDIDDLIFIFRHMRHTPYVAQAVKIWAEGDAKIAELRVLGDRIHQAQRGSGDTHYSDGSLIEVEAVNRDLTRLEDQFSAALGAGARSTGKMMLVAVLSLSIALWVTGTATTRRLLSALSQEREILRATIENAPVGIVLVDSPKGHVRMANTNAWQLLGLGAAGDWESAKHPGRFRASARNRRLQQQVDPVSKALAGEVMRGQDLEWTRPDESKVWVRVSAAPIWRSGNITGAVAAFFDISEERKIGEALLQQSQELARSNEDLEQFAYATSHDLQEPLRNIKLYAQMLAKRLGGELDCETEEIIGVVVSGVDRMHSLINDLLAYSRVTSIHEARMRPVDLNQVVDWACGNLRAKIDENHAVVDGENLPTVWGDEVQLVQVFQNLIDNAIKYRGATSPLVRISAEKTNEGWTVAVQDNGIGISPDYRDRVFGLFKRLHGRSVPGTGIGLAVVKRVIERHGGRIWVESSSGPGATFLFTLPDTVREANNHTAETEASTTIETLQM